MENYYDTLDIDKNSNSKEIEEAYKKKINDYKNLSYLTDDKIKQIKKFKKAYFILSNNELRDKYDKILSKHILSEQKNNIEQKYNNHLIGERIFSLSTIQNKKSKNFDSENNLRNINNNNN